MDFLLKIKNWQLFLIIFLLPWILVIGLVILFDFNSYGDDVTMGIFSLIYYTIFICWNYKVIRTFNKRDQILKTNQLKRLDWLLIILCVYAIYMIIPMDLRLSGNTVIRILSPIVMLISAYAIFFTVFCTAKTLKGLQLKDQLRSSDIIVEMFVILYFPIGVWWLQGKVNKYYNENKARTANKS
jgi:hypothetical protein